MNIAITGATGFIGRHLVTKHLEMGDEVRIMSRKISTQLNFPEQVKIYNIDLLGNIEDFEPFVDKVDILYHCAAEIREESKMFEVNVGGTKNLIQAANGKIKHWVQLSSTGVYGPVMDGNVFESQPLNPINTYERSKVESDNLIIEAGLNNFFNYSILRPSNVFGPDMKNQSLFQLIKAVDKGIFFFIGSHGANANYIPVENVVHALILVGKSKNSKEHIYNVSDVMTLESFIDIIAKKLGKPTPKIRFPLFLMRGLGRVGNLIPNFPLTIGRVNALTNKVKYEHKLIEKELNYVPIISMEKCIENLVDAYKR